MTRSRRRVSSSRKKAERRGRRKRRRRRRKRRAFVHRFSISCSDSISVGFQSRRQPNHDVFGGEVQRRHHASFPYLRKSAMITWKPMQTHISHSPLAVVPLWIHPYDQYKVHNMIGSADDSCLSAFCETYYYAVKVDAFKTQIT